MAPSLSGAVFIALFLLTKKNARTRGGLRTICECFKPFVFRPERALIFPFFLKAHRMNTRSNSNTTLAIWIVMAAIFLSIALLWIATIKDGNQLTTEDHEKVAVPYE
jgi:hypothetical protein